MRPALRFAVGALVICWGPTVSAAADPDPFQHARDLQMAQDRLVVGQGSAVLEQQRLLDIMAEVFERTPTARWQDPRNGRALVVYLLNGGRPSVARQLVQRGIAPAVDEKLLSAVMAFAERRSGAAGAMASIDALSLHPNLAGPVAFSQGLLFQSEPAKAHRFFSVARLMAPGTLVEEAALRREITLLLVQKKPDEALALSKRYVWRFPNSIYVNDVVAHLATTILPELAAFPSKQSDVVAFLHMLTATVRTDVLAAMAAHGLETGKLDLVGFISTVALQLGERTGDGRSRFAAYLAVAAAFATASQDAVAQLQAIDRSDLSQSDQGVVDGAIALLHQALAQPTANARISFDAQPMGEPSAAIIETRRVIKAADMSLTETLP
jgi:chemotaxis protein MotC